MSRNPGTDLGLRAASTDRGKAGRGHWAGCLAIAGGNLVVRVRERYRASSASAGERSTVLGNSFDVVPRSEAVFWPSSLGTVHDCARLPPLANRPNDRPQPTPALTRVPHLSARFSSLARAAFPHRGYLCFTRTSLSLVNRIGVCTDKATSLSQSDERMGSGQGSDSLEALDISDRCNLKE